MNPRVFLGILFLGWILVLLFFWSPLKLLVELSLQSYCGVNKSAVQANSESASKATNEAEKGTKGGIFLQATSKCPTGMIDQLTIKNEAGDGNGK
jgi:hypothetical protein